MSIKHGMLQFIRTRRRSAPLALAATAARKYLAAWHNEAWFNFDENGEAFALRQFARWSKNKPITVWDVGAHRGEWSDAALSLLPAGHIHSFEIVPSIARDIPPHDRRTVHVLGLSDKDGQATVHHNTNAETTSSIEDWRGDPLYREASVQEVACETATGDRTAARIGPPDLLKIDVEGHEVSVLRGCAALLAGSDAPAMIQFEYGNTYLYAGSTLRDMYALLPGYAIGRLYPNHVDFRPYAFQDDHFRMGNMIAVKDDRLRAMLS